MVDEKERSHDQIMQRLRRLYADMVFTSEIEKSELFSVADALERSIFDIAKTEAKDNKYASAKQYDKAIDSAKAVYKTFKNIILSNYGL